MRKIKLSLTIKIYLILFLLLLYAPLNSRAIPSIYTVQTGSFNRISAARNQFESIIRKLDEKELDYLRIEAIGKFYAVRLGKFEDRISAETFLKANRQMLPKAIVMDVYFIDERIVRLYKRPASNKKQQPENRLHKLMRKKDYGEVIRNITLEPVDRQIEVISTLVNQKDYKRALEVAESVIVARPEEPRLNGWYGAVLLKMSYPDKAIKYFKKAAELSPDISDYHGGIGYCLFFLERYNEAINEFNKAVTLDPANIDALAGLGVAYRKIGEKDKAMDVYDRLGALDKDTANMVLQLIKRKTL